MSPDRSVALVHDYLLAMRGAERTFAHIAALWPDAPVYTLLCDPAISRDRFAGHPIVTSKLQHLGARQENFRRLLPLFPAGVERLPVREHDLVVSSSSAFAHGVKPGPEAQHVCYCHTPFRYAWHDYAAAIASAPWHTRAALRAVLKRIRDWDIDVSRRVTHYLANSQLAQLRIAEFYGRDAPVVHPPVDVDRFRVGEPEDYFLIVAELVRHKRVDFALEAAARASARVVVVGSGPELPRLRATYGGSTTFAGRVGDEELADLFGRARALIVPNIEEFGIAAVEVQASGRPVVGVRAGGLRETVVEGETGVLVPPEDLGALAEALRETDFESFDPQHIRRHATQFSVDEFRRRFVDAIERLTGIPVGAS